MHPIEEFRQRLDAFGDYPPDVKPVPAILPGTAAFAASIGLWRPARSTGLPDFPHGKLMIVGHNLDSFSAYDGPP